MKTVYIIVKPECQTLPALGKGNWTTRNFARRFSTEEKATEVLNLLASHNPGVYDIEPRQVGDKISAE